MHTGFELYILVSKGRQSRQHCDIHCNSVILLQTSLDVLTILGKINNFFPPFPCIFVNLQNTSKRAGILFHTGTVGKSSFIL